MNIKYLILSLVISLFVSVPMYSQEKNHDAQRDVIINDVVHFRPWREKRILKVSQLNPKDDNEYYVFYMHDIERFIFTPADTLGSDFIRYSFAERNGRLFVWMDSTAVVTQELIDVLEKYNFIEFKPLDREWYYGENMMYDDGSRCLKYWFCPSSTKFARRFLTPPFQRFFNNTRKGPPRLKCK